MISDENNTENIIFEFYRDHGIRSPIIKTFIMESDVMKQVSGSTHTHIQIYNYILI